METRKHQHDDNQETLPPERILVFFSYARRDQTLRDHLENHLSILKYRGLITTWHAREISAGQEAIQQIDIHLNAAHIILLLISANFLASQYCVSQELLSALERHERGQAHVIPVLLRPVLLTGAPFAKLQPLPTNGKPVTRWRDREEAFYDIARGIERLVLELRAPTRGRVVSEAVASSSAPRASTRFGISTRWQIPGTVLLTCLVLLLGVTFINSQLFFINGQLLPGPPCGYCSSSAINIAPFIGAGLLLLTALLTGWMALRIRKRVRQIKQARRQEETHHPRESRVYYEQALDAYEQALRQESTNADALRGKGNALVGLSRYDEALAAFEQAVTLTPHPATYVSMGSVLATLERFDEAVSAYEQALLLDATYASAYTGMSEVLSHLGRTQEAEQASAQAKQLGEED